MNNRMTENEKDIQMLRTDPGGLILKYQETVKIIVKKYILAGMFKPSDFEDIVQEITSALLVKIPAMQSHYNGTSLFKTYFSVIVRNICVKEHAKFKKEITADQEDTGGLTDRGHGEENILFEEEAQRLRNILSLYYRQRPKLLLCLKLHYRIPITHEDIRLWYPQCGSQDCDMLLKHFGVNFDMQNDVEIFRTLTPVMNRNEGKLNSVDAVRKWTDSKIHEIIKLLNGNPQRRNHNEETLKILVDDFFSPFLLEK
jgi:DNA-directed RNA polymerase specialized sigma24 family protein